MAEPRQVRGARTGPQAVPQAHARHAHPTAAGAGAVPSVPDAEQPAGAEPDRVRFRGGERSRRQLLRPRPTRPRAASGLLPIRHGRRDLGGVLTQAAILAGLSDGRESNPVKRGAWLARKIIAEPPDDPPPNVPGPQGRHAGSSRSASGSNGTATSPAAPSATRRSTRGACRSRSSTPAGG